MNHLANDVCRCHDAVCPERNVCQRWIDREYLPHAVRVVHAASLGAPLADGQCAARIPPCLREAAA